MTIPCQAVKTEGRTTIGSLPSTSSIGTMVEALTIHLTTYRNQELNKEIVFQSLSEARRFFNVKGNGTVVYGKAFNRGKMKGWIIEKCDKDIV